MGKALRRRRGTCWRRGGHVCVNASILTFPRNGVFTCSFKTPPYEVVTNHEGRESFYKAECSPAFF